MRKYRLSTKYRGPRNELVDYVGLSSITNYSRHLQKDNNLDSNLNKVYIRNFYEYQHRKRPGEGKTAKQEYNEELKRENKKKRLRDLENQVSFDSLTSNSSFDSTEGEEHSDEQVNGYAYEKTNEKPNDKVNGNVKISALPKNGPPKSELNNGFKAKKPDKKYTRTRIDRNSKDFFDTLLSTGKKAQHFENEYKKCVKTYKELNTAKQLQAYQLETLNDNYDALDESYDCLNNKYKFINRECKLIEKDIERLKADYCRLVKQDLIKKNEILKDNDYIPIYDEIKAIDLDVLGDLKDYERAYDKYNYYVDYDEYKRLRKLNNDILSGSGLVVSGSCDSLNKLNEKEQIIDDRKEKVQIEINGNGYENESQFDSISNKLDQQELDDQLKEKTKKKEQVEDILYLFINKADCTAFCDKVNQLMQDNYRFKNKIKRLQFDISNEKRKNSIRKNQRNGVVDFEFSNNLDSHKPLSRHTRHTINITNRPSLTNGSSLNKQIDKQKKQNLSSNKSINKFGSRISVLNVFEIPSPKIEIFQMKLKMERKELDMKLESLKKMKNLVESKFELQKKSLENSKQTEKEYVKEQKDLSEKVQQLKLKEQKLVKENESLLKKLHQLMI